MVIMRGLCSFRAFVAATTANLRSQHLQATTAQRCCHQHNCHSPAGQAHLPAWHVLSPVHGAPQAPQWVELVGRCVSQARPLVVQLA